MSSPVSTMRPMRSSPPTSDQVACRDPECDGSAELEQDGDIRYFACAECGFEFDYQRLAVQVESACPVGVPEEIRRRTSPAPVRAPVLLQIGMRPPDDGPGNH